MIKNPLKVGNYVVLPYDWFNENPKIWNKVRIKSRATGGAFCKEDYFSFATYGDLPISVVRLYQEKYKITCSKGLPDVA